MSQLRVFGFVIFTLTMIACSGQDGSAELTENQRNLVAERIAPQGTVVMAGQAVVSAVAAAVRTGESIYASNCQSCHNIGVAGAPKMGDVAAWADRLTKGVETVYANAINGIGAMPAKGTCMDCSDDDIIATIDYMLENSKQLILVQRLKTRFVAGFLLSDVYFMASETRAWVQQKCRQCLIGQTDNFGRKIRR